MATVKRAISIRQPYVEQILRGEKTWEYRSQNTKIRECVYLCASKTPGPDMLPLRHGFREQPYGFLIVYDIRY